MGTASAISHLARETTEAAGPGRWVNCGVDPMRARVFWPNTPWPKPLSHKLSLFARKFVSTSLTSDTNMLLSRCERRARLLVSQEARYVEHLVRAELPARRVAAPGVRTGSA